MLRNQRRRKYLAPSITVREPSAIGLRVFLAVTAMAALLQACASAAASQPTSAPRLEVPPISRSLTTVQVAPRDTDPAITNWPNQHLVAFDPSVNARKELFLFLPGTGANPAVYSVAIIKQAAANGFDAISLSYPSTFSPSLCTSSPNRACFETIRQQILSGGAEDPRAAVSAADSLQNRLVKLLQFLAAHQPSRQWTLYLDGSTPRWSMIRLAGHSQGASMAAFIAIHHKVDRVTLFSGPTDVSADGAGTRPAFWITDHGATPASRYYAFTHLRDETGINFIAAWTALDLKGIGAPVNIDDSQTPFRHSHVLVTNASPAPITPRPGPETTLPYHLIVAGSRLLPLTAAGQPVFASAWQYLCFA